MRTKRNGLALHPIRSSFTCSILILLLASEVLRFILAMPFVVEAAFSYISFLAQPFFVHSDFFDIEKPSFILCPTSVSSPGATKKVHWTLLDDGEE